MLIEIIKRTFPWVFVLLAALLAMGYAQSKDRTIGRGRVAILPVTMIGLSIYGVVSAFGIGALQTAGLLRTATGFTRMPIQPGSRESQCSKGCRGQGTLIFSHDNVRERLQEGSFLAEFEMKLEAVSKKGLPVVTFSADISFLKVIAGSK